MHPSVCIMENSFNGLECLSCTWTIVYLCRFFSVFIISVRPTGSDLFRFTWLLFIKSRASFPAVTDDLVNSYHLLACCLDWTLGAVMLSRRRDLINMEQNGLPRDFLTSVAQNKTWCPPHDEPTCMLRPICEDNDVNYVECKTVKEHFFRPFMLRLIEKVSIIYLRSYALVHTYFRESILSTVKYLSDCKCI